MDTCAKSRAGFDEFMRVVAVCAADDDHDIALFGQFDGCVLTLFGGLADSVNEPYFGPGKSLAEELDEFADAINGLGGLCDDAEPPTFVKAVYVFC